MSRIAIIVTLLFAAILEASGDALVRSGMHAEQPWRRACFFGVAMIVLFLYGWTVNSPPWNFGRLLGLYVVFFFVVAQILSWIVFKQAPSAMVLLGGTLIVAGGVIVSLARI
jgi:drug/metabolite transporter superfamily protein YnfA